MKKTIYAIALSATMILLASCAGNKEEAPAAAADNTPKYRAAVDLFFNAWTTGNTDAIDSVVDVNFTEHTPPPNMEVKGIEGLKNIIKENYKGFPDSKVTIINYIESGDMAVVHYNWKGTNTGDCMGMPATNKAIDVDGADILKFANGKCTDHWGYFEESKFMTQLGLMPEMHAMTGDSTKAK